MKAAANDSTLAFMKLGEIYEEGTLVKKDLRQAKEWYTKSYNILYHDLQSKKKFQTKIKEVDIMLLVKEAKECNIPAMFKLGNLLETGNDLVDKDILKAKELYTKGIDLLKDNPKHVNFKDYYNKFITHRDTIEAMQLETDCKLNRLNNKVDSLLNKFSLLNKLQKDFDYYNISDISLLAVGYQEGHWGKKDLVKAKELYILGAKLIEHIPVYKGDYNMFIKRIDNLNILISNALNRPTFFD
jgi:TPR repeat protein